MRISELRQTKNISQRELAEAIGVKNYTVANWEQGRSEPSVMDLSALADYFDCSVDYLIGREDELGITRAEFKEYGLDSEFIKKFTKLSKQKQKLIAELVDDIYISEKRKK